MRVISDEMFDILTLVTCKTRPRSIFSFALVDDHRSQMDDKESLSKLLSLLIKNDGYIRGGDHAKKETDLEETAALLHLGNNNFSNIALALDELSSLNSAATEFNRDALKVLASLGESYNNILSGEPCPLNVPDTESQGSVSLKTPSEAQLAKYNFAAAGLKENLANAKIYPYHQPTDVGIGDTAEDVDTLLRSKESDVVLSLQTIDRASKRIIKLRKENNNKEELLNLDYDFSHHGHLLSDDGNTLTDKMIKEIERMEKECARLDADLSSVLHASCNYND